MRFKPTGKYKKAYERGKKAFADGFSLDDNPHLIWCQDQKLLSTWWQTGFNHKTKSE